MIDLLILVLVATVAVGVLLLPSWSGRRDRRLERTLERYRSALAALAKGPGPEAEGALEAIIRADTEDVAAYVALAGLLERAGKCEKAARLLEVVRARRLRERTVEVEVLAGLARCLLRQGEAAKALEVVERLRRVDRRHPMVAEVRVAAALERGDFDAAVREAWSFEKGLRSDGTVYGAAVATHAARLSYNRGDIQAAVSLLESVVHRQPGYGPALLLLGEAYEASKQYERAIESWRRLLKRTPEALALVKQKLEHAFFETGRFSQLQGFYEELLAKDPNSAPVRMALAELASKQQAFDEALGHLEVVLEKEPMEPSVNLMRMQVLAQAGKPVAPIDGLLERLETARLSQGRCPRCGERAEVDRCRCASCGAWLPDPFAEGAPGGRPSSGSQ